MTKSCGHAPSPALPPAPVRREPRTAALVGTALLLGASAALAGGLQVLDGQGRPVAGAQVQALAPARGSDVLSRLMPPLFTLETGADGGVGARLPKLEGLLLIVDHPSFAPVRIEGSDAGRRTSV